MLRIAQCRDRAPSLTTGLFGYPQLGARHRRLKIPGRWNDEGRAMCYSAMIWADYRKYVKLLNSKISIKDFLEIFWWRYRPEEVHDKARKVTIPKAMELAFAESDSTDADMVEIRRLIDAYSAERATEMQQELFKQRKRLADAERTLSTKPTKKAADDQRIAGNKIRQIRGWLEDLERSTVEARDSRIYPMHYAPVIVWEDGQRIVKPMRYHCRPAGKPAKIDLEFPGLYNARRDSLPRFWRGQFGYMHGVMVAEAFYENVYRHRAEGRELGAGEKPENLVLEFRPNMNGPMLVACLWSKWKAPEGSSEPDLLSFAAITDDPPPEVSAAGHDRCIIPLKPENVDAWLNPAGDVARMQEILDDRERPYYEHRLAA